LLRFRVSVWNEDVHLKTEIFRSESKLKRKERELTPSPVRVDSTRRITDADFDQNAVWSAEEKLTLEERRERYLHPDFVTIDDIPTWSHYAEARPLLDKTKCKEKVIKMLLKYQMVTPEQFTKIRSGSVHQVLDETKSPSSQSPQSECSVSSSENIQSKGNENSKAAESKEHLLASSTPEMRNIVEDKSHSPPHTENSPSKEWKSSLISSSSSSPQSGEVKLIIKEIGVDEEERFKDDVNELEGLDWEADEELNSKISLWRGDITKLEIDAIVNAAHESLLGGGGVDGAIHHAAGEGLRRECQIFNGCDVGDTKITRGHNLPAKYVLHTVGPKFWGKIESLPKGKLKSCYRTCLELISKYNIRTVAFCCVSTGLFNYPNKPAAFTAVKMIREWFKQPENKNRIDRIVFCVDNEKDLDIYEKLLQLFFPLKRQSQVTQLPCYIKDRWSILRKALSQQLKNVDELTEFIQKYGINSDADLSGIKVLFGRLNESETRNFFEKTLPGIMKLASKLHRICVDEQKTLASVKEEAIDLTDSQKEKEFSEPGPIPLLIENLDRTVSLTQDKIASLLACGFLCLLPRQKFHNQHFGDMNFYPLWRGFHLEDKIVYDKESILSVQTTKLKCIIHYFNRIIDKERDDVVQFRRKVFTVVANPPWQKLDFPLDDFTLSTTSDMPIYNAVHLSAKQTNEEVVILLETPSSFGSEWFTPRDFVTPHEVVVFTHPEVMVAALITSKLLKNEALEVRGAENFCECSVDKNGRHFKFVKNVTDTTKIELRQRKRCFLFADPLREPDFSLQLKRYNIAREFNRLYAALQFDARGKHYTIVSGDWGCDLLNGGDPNLKTLLLLLVIAAVNHNVRRLAVFAATGSMSPPSSPTSSLIKINPEKSNKNKKAEKSQPPQLLSLMLCGSSVASKLLQLSNIIRKEDVPIKDILIKLSTEFQTTSSEELLSRLKTRFKHWKKEMRQSQREQEKIDKRRLRAQSWAGGGLRSRTVPPRPEHLSPKMEYSSSPPRALSLSMSPITGDYSSSPPRTLSASMSPPKSKSEPKRVRALSHSVASQSLQATSVQVQQPQSLSVTPEKSPPLIKTGGTESPTSQSPPLQRKSTSPSIGPKICITAEVKLSQEFDLNSIFSPRRSRSQRLIVFDPPQTTTQSGGQLTTSQNAATKFTETKTEQKERIIEDKRPPPVQETPTNIEAEKKLSITTPPSSEVRHPTKSAPVLISTSRKSHRKREHKSPHEKKQKSKSKDR